MIIEVRSNSPSKAKILKEKVEQLLGQDANVKVKSWQGQWSPFGRPTYFCVYSVNGIFASDRDNTRGGSDAANGWRPKTGGVPWNTLLKQMDEGFATKARKDKFWDWDGNLIENYDEGFLQDVESLDYRRFTGEISPTYIRRDISRIHKKPIYPGSESTDAPPA